jgi:hypothetical protein
MSETEGSKEVGVPRASDPEPPPPAAAPEGEEGEESGEGGVELDPVDVRDLLRAALEPPAPKARKDDALLLKGVQRRIRLRSKGKFYADGWSTSRSPRSTYLVTSIFMLVLIAFVFLVLIPWSNSALP